MPGRRKQGQPGAAKPRGSKTLSSKQRLEWAHTEWKANPKIPINGDGGMIRRMKEVFGLASSYEVLSKIRKEALAELKAETPPADKPPANGKGNGVGIMAPRQAAPQPDSREINLRKARAARSSKAGARRDWAAAAWRAEPWVPVTEMADRVRAALGSGTSGLHAVRKEVLAELGYDKPPRQPEPDFKLTPTAPAAPAKTPATEEDSIRTIVGLLRDEFPTLIRFTLTVDDAGSVDVDYEFRRRHTLKIGD
jgi:hypothetical protein